MIQIAYYRQAFLFKNKFDCFLNNLLFLKSRSYFLFLQEQIKDIIIIGVFG